MYSVFVPAGNRMPVMAGPVDGTEVPDEQIPGPHTKGARMVRAAIGSLSSRGAAQKMGARGYTLNHTTINNMRNGHAVESDSIIKFARGFRLDSNKLLEAFGLHPTEKGGEASAEEQVEYLVNVDELTPEGYNDYDDLPPAVREAARAAATQAAKTTYKTIADAIREVRRDSPGTVGGAGPVEKDKE